MSAALAPNPTRSPPSLSRSVCAVLGAVARGAASDRFVLIRRAAGSALGASSIRIPAPEVSPRWLPPSVLELLEASPSPWRVALGTVRDGQSLAAASLSALAVDVAIPFRYVNPRDPTRTTGRQWHFDPRKVAEVLARLDAYSVPPTLVVKALSSARRSKRSGKNSRPRSSRRSRSRTCASGSASRYRLPAPGGLRRTLARWPAPNTHLLRTSRDSDRPGCQSSVPSMRFAPRTPPRPGPASRNCAPRPSNASRRGRGRRTDPRSSSAWRPSSRSSRPAKKRPSTSPSRLASRSRTGPKSGSAVRVGQRPPRTPARPSRTAKLVSVRSTRRTPFGRGAAVRTTSRAAASCRAPNKGRSPRPLVARCPSPRLWTPPGPAATDICVTCRADFAFSREFYRRLRLRPPTRCRRCRRARQVRRERLRGVIRNRGIHNYGFILGETGEQFFVTPLREWQRKDVAVTFEADPGECPESPRCRRAFNVTRVAE